MKKVWLIRHGESAANAGLVTSDTITTPLTEEGIKQSYQLIPKICNDIRPDLIVESRYLRSKQTAAPLIEFCPNVKVEEWEVQEFSFLSAERYKNTNMEQRKPFVDKYWRDCNIYSKDDEKSESFLDLIFRIESVKNRIYKFLYSDTNWNKGVNICIFTHGQFMKTFLWTILFDIDSANVTPFSKESGYFQMENFVKFMHRVDIANCSIVKFEVNGEYNYDYKLCVT